MVGAREDGSYELRDFVAFSLTWKVNVKVRAMSEWSVARTHGDEGDVGGLKLYECNCH